MKPAPPPVRALALQLLAKETGKGEGETPAFAVCAKLGLLLTRLAGQAGFHSLLTRALAIASKEAPWLNTLKVLPDGSFEGLEEARSRTGKKEIENGGLIFVSHLVHLLYTFIGEALTMQLIKEGWPDLIAKTEPPTEAPEP
ncbi:MAG: hypothetical protein ABI599_15690 [Flavobacteriales bacterium]